MATKVEFASPEWHALLKATLERHTAMVGPELELTICEVFTGVPAHLDRNGDGIIAWNCLIRDGKVEFRDGEVPEADIKTIADYDFVIQLARMRIEPDTQDAYRALQEQGVASGKLKPSGDTSRIPPSFYGMHNELAEVTA